MDSSAKQISKTSIILTGTDTWDDWMSNIRRLALFADIWDHINPDNDAILLNKPGFSTYSLVKASTTAFSSFTLEEQEEWQHINHRYTKNNDDYKRKCKAMNNLMGRIQDTIDKKGISYIAKYDTIHQILQKLKSKYYTIEETRKIELAARFRHLLSSVPKSRNPEDWLSDLE